MLHLCIFFHRRRPHWVDTALTMPTLRGAQRVNANGANSIGENDAYDGYVCHSRCSVLGIRGSPYRTLLCSSTLSTRTLLGSCDTTSRRTFEVLSKAQLGWVC